MKLKLFDMDLDQLIKESTSAAVQETIEGDERLLQKQKSSQMRSFKASKKKSKMDQKDKDKDVDEGSEEPSDLKSPVKAKKSELPEITLAKIIDKLNSLRAGKSLKDKVIKKGLNDYFTRLNGNERIALYAFLSGLEKIMGSEEEAVDAADTPAPTDEPYKIKMKKSAPKVDKKPAAGEDSPIVVGERASKSRELSILSENK